MPEKARRGSQKSLNGVKRSHLATVHPSMPTIMIACLFLAYASYTATCAAKHACMLTPLIRSIAIVQLCSQPGGHQKFMVQDHLSTISCAPACRISCTSKMGARNRRRKVTLNWYPDHQCAAWYRLQHTPIC